MEEKSCENCSWKYKYPIQRWCSFSKEEPKKCCSEHNFRCKCGDIAQYNYKGKRYCSECILKKFEVEECIEIDYYLDGEYLGNSDDIDEVIRNIDDDIERI